MNDLVAMAKELARLQDVEYSVNDLLMRHNLFISWDSFKRRFELMVNRTTPIPTGSAFRQYAIAPDEGAILCSSRSYGDCVEVALTHISEMAKA